jgi:putative ABC transport system permease protein
MNYFKLSFRNILRHKNRSFVTIMTVCLGFTALGVIGGMLTNIFSRLKTQAIVGEKLGHITIAKEGFFAHEKTEPEKYLWTKNEVDGILKILKTNPNVTLATPRLRMFGIASNGKASTIFITEAIIPEDDQRLIQTPVDGRSDARVAVSLNAQRSKSSEVAIGSELSSTLGLHQGASFTLLTTTKDGMANAMDVNVAKVYNTGNPSTNDKFILTDFSLAQQLYDTDGAERIVVTIKHPGNVAIVKQQLLDQLEATGYKVEVKGWEELSKTYGKVTTMFGVIFRVLTIIITVIVLLTLLNTMQMAVVERTREIGTMRAIGMIRKDVVKIFCTEGVMMSLFGCLLAIPVLLMISGILQLANASFTPPVASVPVPLVLMLNPGKLMLVFGLFCFASLLSSFLVSQRVARQKVADALL